MNLRDSDILDVIYEHLNFVYESPEMRSKEAGIPGEFPFHQWNYHESIKNGDMGIATDPLENINPKLKSKMDRGYLTQKSAFKKLKIFEEDEICFYTSPVAQNNEAFEKN